MGKMRAPYYRIVVADSRTKRDGRAIEEIGQYHPTQDPSYIQVNSERAAYWLGVGAQPTEPVKAILKVTGDWQRFRGEPGAEGTLRTPAPKLDKRAAFEQAAREGADEPRTGATTPRKRASERAASTGGDGEQTTGAAPAAPDRPDEGSAPSPAAAAGSPAPDAGAASS
jgi:small subunit ribosomal protein S16